MAKLTAKQQRFVDEYLVDLNATQAAIRAGYSAKTAQEQSSRLLSNVMVQAAIQEAMKAREKRTHLTQDEVLLQIARMLRFDMRSIYNADGSLKNPHELDEETALVVGGYDVVEMAGGLEISTDGGTKHVPMYTKKVKLPDKNATLQLAMRHFGLLVDKVALQNPNGSPLSQLSGVLAVPVAVTAEAWEALAAKNPPAKK